jgi:predicted nucleic acid-binding protein
MHKVIEDFNTFIVEWIDEKYRPFIYLALKLSTQKYWMKKIK